VVTKPATLQRVSKVVIIPTTLIEGLSQMETKTCLGVTKHFELAKYLRNLQGMMHLKDFRKFVFLK